MTPSFLSVALVVARMFLAQTAIASPSSETPVATIRVTYANGTSTTCSGFYIDDTTLVTVRHALSGATSAEVIVDNEHIPINGILGVVEQGDVILLSARKPDSRVALSVVDENVAVGARVTVPVIASDFEPSSNTRWHVRSWRNTRLDGKTFITTMPAVAGRSGTPILDEHGRVVGMLTHGVFVQSRLLSCGVPSSLLVRALGQLGRTSVCPVGGSHANPVDLRADGLMCIAEEKAMQQREVASQALYDLLKIRPDDWRARHLLAAILINMDKTEDAREVIGEWEATGSELWLCHLVHAAAMVHDGNMQEAISLYSRSLQLEPSPEGKWGLAHAYIKTGRYDEAIEILHSADNADLVDPTWFAIESDAYVGMRKWADAATAAKKVIELEYSATAWARLSRIQRMQSDPAVADTATRVLDFTDATSTECVEAGLGYFGAGELNKANGAMERAISIDNSAEAWRWRSVIANSDGKYAEAINILEHAVKAHPDDARLLYELGQAYLRAGRREAAVEVVELIKKLDEKAADALRTRIEDAPPHR